MLSTTPEPASRKPRWRRMAGAVRRSLSRSSTRPSSPSPSERERDSDVASLKGSSKPSSLRLVDTAALSSPAPAGSGVPSIPSPIAESPAREAASSDMFAGFSEKMLDAGIPNGVAVTPPASAVADQSALTKPETRSQPATTPITSSSAEIGRSTDSSLILVQDISIDPSQDKPTSGEETSDSHAATPIPEAVPSVDRDSIKNTVSGMNAKDGVSTKPRKRSSEVPAGSSNSNRNAGRGKGSSIGLMSTLADLRPYNAPSGPLASSANVSETPQPRAKERYEPAASVPLPAIQNPKGQNIPSQNGSAENNEHPENPARKPADTTKAPVSRGRANPDRDEPNNWLAIGVVAGAVGVLVFVLARR